MLLAPQRPPCARSPSPAEPHSQDGAFERAHWLGATTQQLLKLLPRLSQGQLQHNSLGLDDFADLDPDEPCGRWLDAMAQQVQNPDYTEKLFGDLRNGPEDVRLRASYELRDNVIVLSRGRTANLSSARR